MIIRRTRFDDLDDWLDSVDWGKVKENTGAPLMKLIRIYIRWIGKVSEFVGGIAMYLLLAMMGILLYSIITNAFHRPVIWIMEMSQFTMAAYYILGGASSLKHGIHVRMDFLYERWKPPMAPIKIVMTAGMALMFLQATAELLKDFCKAIGRKY